MTGVQTCALPICGRGAATAEWRAHWAPQARCRTDLFLTLSGLSNGAATATLEGRYRVAPGNTFAPTIEAFAVPPVGGAVTVIVLCLPGCRGSEVAEDFPCRERR